jgi:hypothetical protein
MSTTRDTGFLRNAVQVTNQGIVFVSGSTLLMSISSSGAVTTTGVISGSNALSASYSISSSYSVSSSYAYTASSAVSASYVLNAVSASYAYTASSATNATSASKAVSSSYSDTASFANNFTVLGNLTVFGTQSVQYITSSQLNVSDNVITVNVASPGVRFGGLSVYDSGSLSSEATASLFWDSQNNHWIYQRESGSTYNGGMLISGPRNFAGLGNEQGTTSGSLMKGQGGDHMTSSAIFEDGYKATFYTNSLVVSSSGFVGIGATDPVKTLDVRGTLAISNNASSYWYMDRSDDDGRFKILTDGNSEKFSIAATGVAIFSGSVGIGAVTPSVLLNTFLNDDLTTIQIRAESNTSAVVTYTGLGSSVLEYYRNVATGVDLTIQTKIVSSGGGGNIVFSPNSPSVNLTPVERMRITKDGNVGIGTTGPLTTLSVRGSGANGILLDQDAASVNASSRLFFKMSTQAYTILADNNGLNFMSDATPGSSSGAVKMTMNSSGSVGIGTSTIASDVLLHLKQSASNLNLYLQNTLGSGKTWALNSDTNGSFNIHDTAANRLSINSSGYVRVNGPVSGFDGSSAQFQINGFTRMQSMFMHNSSNPAQAVSLSCTGTNTFYVDGTFTAYSKSFLIPHPLTNLKETHNLRYVSVESPQADLIYRGKIRLIAGRATVNMDEAATMTEGTFEALCREVQCFTSNESGWDLTKGTVDGNILTIESQNTESTDEISWLIIGERQDEYMMNTDWTDSNGRVIVEPLAPEENNIF